MITPQTVSDTKRSGNLGNNPEFLTLKQARKLVLLSTGLPPRKQAGKAIESTLKVVEQLGYVQIDTISAVQRAHHHTLWSRNPRYKNTHLQELIVQKKVFEYWTHAAAFLPMRDYRYSLPLKHAMAQDHQNHWFSGNESLNEEVLARIAAEGPLMSKDFVHTGAKIQKWDSRPAKRALAILFMQGKLMISRRVNFHKVFDLTERVLPIGVNTSSPSPEEHARFLITQFLKSNGIGQLSEITYLRRRFKTLIATTISKMEAYGELVEVITEGTTYFTLPSSLTLLGKPLKRSKLKILSPFDNLLIQRRRIRSLFGFEYLLECYLPKEKRLYGYFSLPLLWDAMLVGRMDCRAERKKSILHINNLIIEPGVKRKEQLLEALSSELIPFLKFNNCESIVVHRMTPVSLKTPWEKMLKEKFPK